jgi:LETM1 and EF-hand domain-containing protein 1
VSQSVLSPLCQKFYFRGLKLVIKHRREAQVIQARVKAGGVPLSRWESRFIQTNNSDLARYLTPQPQALFVILFLTFPELRLVPFVAIVLVVEEVIPLIVLYAPGMLPSTCLLASQRERIEAKRYEKQRTYAEEMRDAFLEVRKATATALVSSLPSTNSGVGLCGQVNFDSVMN